MLRKVKHGFETNKERLTLLKVWGSESLRARIWLVVAMRLQVQHSSFWLRTSSNTPSVLMNDVHWSFANSDREMRFLSYNFCLKKRLGEPAQFKIRLQFGWARHPVRTNLQLSSNTRNNAWWQPHEWSCSEMEGPKCSWESWDVIS
jgi:hypothetical protein